MNYATTENLAQKTQMMGNNLNKLFYEIEMEGLESSDKGWVLSRLNEVREYQKEILSVLNKQIEIDRF